MKHATKVAKAFEHRGATSTKVNTKPALAPDALSASVKIADIVSTGSPTKAAKNVSAAPAVQQNLGDSRINATSKNKVIFPTLAKQSQPSNFDDWDPEPVSAPLNDTLDALPRPVMVERMQKSIQAVLQQGVMCAASKTVPVSDIPNKAVEGIISRLKNLDASVEAVLNAELRVVAADYSYSAARASVEYLLRDPLEAKSHGISLTKLHDDSAYRLWVNQEYLVDEWRKLRNTGIDRAKIDKVLRRADSTVCAFLPIMLTIQSIWVNNGLPAAWWDSMKLSNRSSYGDTLLTNVNDLVFRAKFPLTTSEFMSHNEVFCKSVHDGLAEFWLTEVGMKLSAYIASLGPAEGRCIAIEDDEEEVLEQTMDESVQFEASGVESVPGDEIKALEKQASKALSQRLALELSRSAAALATRDESRPRPDEAPPLKQTNKAAKVLDSAAVLLSKQLRSMCEASLDSLANLFERLRDPHTADYSVFVVNMRVQALSSKELINDLNDPVEVCLHPDIAEIKGAVLETIRSLVGASRDFPRPENLHMYGSSFGGSNNAMVSEFIQRNYARRLNSCVVHMDDEIVIDVMQRIDAALDEFFEAPRKLLHHFDVMQDLLTGQVSAKVVAALEFCKTSTDHIDNLERLNVVCRDLDALVISIRELVPDVSHFPGFEVKSTELKELLINHVTGLHDFIIETVAADNREHMFNLCSQFQTICTTLDKKPTDASALKQLISFTNNAAFTMNDLADQYKNICFERIRFLLANKYDSRKDVPNVLATYSWPSTIEASMRKSYEQTIECKHELEELLGEDQRKLESDIVELMKKIDILADQPSAQVGTIVIVSICFAFNVLTVGV